MAPVITPYQVIEFPHHFVNVDTIHVFRALAHSIERASEPLATGGSIVIWPVPRAFERRQSV